MLQSIYVGVQAREWLHEPITVLLLYQEDVGWEQGL